MIITGDLHGDPVRFSKRSMQQHPMKDDEIVVICGDFGLSWADDKSDKYWLDWLSKNANLLLYSFPVKEWHGGRVHELRPNVLHLMRGEIFEIDGLRVLAFGGAASHDKEARKPYISWWPEEIPNAADFENACKNLGSVGWEVDLALTHTAPGSIVQLLVDNTGQNDDPTCKMLYAIQNKLIFQHWYL